MNRLTSRWYEHFVRPLLFRMDPETAHHLALRALRVPGALAGLRGFGPAAQPLMLFGVSFRNPLGLAAGFDKNGVALPVWEALGFGFVEIGTVTARPQPGNPRPRIFRYSGPEALINRLGFNNDGAEVIAQRLRRLRGSARPPSIPIGINLGKSRLTPIEEAAADYLYSFRLLQPLADYIALNVSSPNTPGLRSLQEHAALVELLRTITSENALFPAPKPILLKIAPDLSEMEMKEIISACEEFAIAGIIATNTTLDHSAIAPDADEQGGLSGSPLRGRSTAVVSFLRAHTRLPIIGVGGIFDAASAREKFEAGAQLLQVYTGYVYRGPGLLREILG
ncbi:MAG: quinone-dependent dihydroorotate dehydrogenase [Chthoniobacterales bacterium]|nr:quinone-dependent dihydroorotate dehydrogenase [Chthoniobacterales bacterium]